MDQFDSTQSNPGMLKNAYEPQGSPLDAALRKKRDSLLQTKKAVIANPSEANNALMDQTNK